MIFSIIMKVNEESARGGHRQVLLAAPAGLGFQQIPSWSCKAPGLVPGNQLHMGERVSLGLSVKLSANYNHYTNLIRFRVIKVGLQVNGAKF